MSADGESARSWAWKDGWTQGRSVGFLPKSLFYKDETGKLNGDLDVVFFQDWESPNREDWHSIIEPAVVDHPDTEAERYDRRNVVGRFWWIRWAAGQDGHPGYVPMLITKRLLAFIATLGEAYEGVGTTGLPACRSQFNVAGPWHSVVCERFAMSKVEDSQLVK